MTNHNLKHDLKHDLKHGLKHDLKHGLKHDLKHDPNRPDSRAIASARMRNALLKSRATLPALAAVAALGGCVAVGGSRSLNQPTIGRELIDLKAAHEAGAIDAAEYAAAKQRLLEGERR